MTITQAVTSFCGIEVPGGTVELEIINGNLNGAGTYSAPLESQVAKVAYAVLSAMLPLSSFKEGDLTIQINTAGVKARLEYLSKKYGFEDVLEVGKPTVRDRSYLW